MPDLASVVNLNEHVVKDAARWYDPNRIPDAFADIDPRIARKAFRLAGNDWRRVVRDGNEPALTVLNAVSW